MMGHKICLFGEIRKIISKLYLLLLLIWSSDKGCKYPTHFFRFFFFTGDYLPSPPCLSMPFTYNVYNDSAHIYGKWLTEALGGGGISKQPFPISISLNYKIWHIQPNFEVFVLEYQKINL